jgi:hypothetical protein
MAEIARLGSPSLKFIRIILSALLLIGAIAYVLDRVDWPPFAAAASRLPTAAIVGSTLCLTAGALLASLRLQWIACDLGYRLSFRDSMSALSLGQVMGSLFFQIAGQLIARGAIMSRRQIPASATIVITGYERFTALAISLSLALIAAIFLFGKVSIDFSHGGTTFIKLMIGLLVAAAAGGAFVWGHRLRVYLPALDIRGLKNLLRIAVISLAIQLTTMAAYVLLANTLAPTIPISNLAAGSALVMLAASLPISFAGWGIREMSAIFVLAAIGVPAEASLTVAVSIGILGFAVVGAMAFTSIGHARRAPGDTAQTDAAPINYGALLDQVLPIAAASAVFFQVFLPLNEGLISVNLADPIAILGGSLFVLHYFGRQWPRWRLSAFNTCVGLASMAIIAAYLHGLARLGWTDWAFANRLLGWPVLLCYGATGALIVHRIGRQGLDLLLLTYAAVAVAIVTLEITLFTAVASGATFLKPMTSVPFNGFSQNRNAFAFVLLLAVGVLLAARWRAQVFWLGIVFAGMFMAGSRAGFIGLAVVLAVAIVIAPKIWPRVAAATAVAIALIIATTLLPMIAHLRFGAAPAWDSIAILTGQILSPVSSDTERLKTLAGGWQLFIDQPIFGAGLGVYMEQQIRQGMPLVIHSTPLWLLAEFGIVGFAVMTAPLVLIFRAEIMRMKKIDVAGQLLILIITGFAVMSLAHELMYQRAFWLLLGVCLAVLPAALPISPASNNN